MRLVDKRLVLTGAAGFLGHEFVERMAREGAIVIDLEVDEQANASSPDADRIHWQSLARTHKMFRMRSKGSLR